MSVIKLKHALSRINHAAPDSPLAVFKYETDDKNKVDCVFANTVMTQHLIKSQAPSFIGVFHSGMNPEKIESMIRAKM